MKTWEIVQMVRYFLHPPLFALFMHEITIMEITIIDASISSIKISYFFSCKLLVEFYHVTGIYLSIYLPNILS